MSSSSRKCIYFKHFAYENRAFTKQLLKVGVLIFKRKEAGNYRGNLFVILAQIAAGMVLRFTLHFEIAENIPYFFHQCKLLKHQTCLYLTFWHGKRQYFRMNSCDVKT